MATIQVSEVLLEPPRQDVKDSPSPKRARVSSSPPQRSSSSSSPAAASRNGGYGDGNPTTEYLPTWRCSFAPPPAAGVTGSESVDPVAELPDAHTLGKAAVIAAASAAATAVSGSSRAHPSGSFALPRSASPTPSYASSSAFSAATTTATTLSSRASLSSCRDPCSTLKLSSRSSSTDAYGRAASSGSGGRYSTGRSSSNAGSGFGFSSSRSLYSSSARQAPSGGDHFPEPSSSWSGSRRGGSSGGGGGGSNSWRRGSSSCCSGSCWSSRDRHFCPPPSRRPVGGGGGKDYASEASTSGRTISGGCSSSRGVKRNRSGSRERGRGGSCTSRRSGADSCSVSSTGVECERCLEWCRTSRAQQQQQKPITRTLQMDYYVRTPRCKAAKSKHIDYIDDVAYSREQFIEETVFTCPFTGARRDIVLERNMFPYDVPTDVEHWTLWSRRDLSTAELETFVTEWAAENHPHAVEWECDNNEGERSIDWFHVHVFFRLGCEDRTGVPRDPDSAYDGPYRRKADAEAEAEAEAEPAVAQGNSGEDDAAGIGVTAAVAVAVGDSA